MNQTTNHTSLKNLTKSILNKLENKKFIIFNPKVRGDLQESMYAMLARVVVTEEDLTNEVRAHVTKVSDDLATQNLTETEAFQSQKRALKSRFVDNEIQGFYLRETLRSVCQRVCRFLFETSMVEDVFESDDAIQKLVMETFQTFDESKIN